MDGVFLGLAGLLLRFGAAWDFPQALPSGNPSKQPGKPSENAVHSSSYTLTNPICFELEVIYLWTLCYYSSHCIHIKQNQKNGIFLPRDIDVFICVTYREFQQPP